VKRATREAGATLTPSTDQAERTLKISDLDVRVRLLGIEDLCDWAFESYGSKALSFPAEAGEGKIVEPCVGLGV
jgi:hypothetical protein